MLSRKIAGKNGRGYAPSEAELPLSRLTNGKADMSEGSRSEKRVGVSFSAGAERASVSRNSMSGVRSSMNRGLAMFSRKSQSNDEELPRLVRVNEPNESYRDNRLPTAHYSLPGFFPATIFHLLRPDVNPANFYFLCVGFLQLVPPISLTRGVPIQWLPLTLIVGVDLGLLFVEELNRHRADHATNNSPVEILTQTEAPRRPARSLGPRAPR